MSVWSETKKEDIEIDGDEINVWIGSDDNGNIYTTIKIADLLDLIKEALISIPREKE